MTEDTTYQTTSLAEAAFLLTIGRSLLGVRTGLSANPTIKTFIFEAECQELASGYYRDQLVPAHTFQSSFQAVRRLIRG